MKILIDIGHPGHVHLFRNFAYCMKEKGHEFLFTCREKEFEIELLKAANLPFVSFGKKYNSTFGKILGLIKFDILELIQGLKFKPDIFMSHGSPYAAHAAAILRKPHVSLEDSGNWEQMKLYLPFTSCVLTPDVLFEDLGNKQIRYQSYHELAYLHPNYFETKNNQHKILNLTPDEKYVIVRFVSWNASHDRGHNGFSETEKERIIDYLASRYRVFITSEGYLPEKYESYKIKIAPEDIHEVLAGAELFIGEGATMAAESGVLGTPSIYVNSIRRSYNEDQEKYGLVFNFQNEKGVFEKIKEIENIPDRKKTFADRRVNLLNDKIDITAFMVWFVENYPKSKDEIINNPQLQFSYK
ncbi:DUF354 domain-containing protein [Aquimarina sp. 2201CG5-10]|uniref:DUF354 domain-containing protein n=1 Tax=Aquimarina callyspongiae TaxID=3098150 RepID=UPI002AB33C41|nr:DUF354 domain-containing protein [Aquimarina sp. 2201CG5-10]MDY8136888.1 DUF354 domain-containing protein [Aquimarina sp. 2201CG5-10]